MIELHLPWLELAILLPILGSLWVGQLHDADQTRRQSLVIAALTLVCAVGAWLDFRLLHIFEAHDRWDVLASLVGVEVFVIDELSAPLLPLTALLFLLTELATVRTKVRRFSFSWAHFSEAILLATLSCKEPWIIVGLLVAGTVPPWVELLARDRPTRVYVVHMGVFVGLLLCGQLLVSLSEQASWSSTTGLGLLVAAVLLRSGTVPVHCWMTDLYERATFGTALLFTTPMVGAYAVLRLVLPIAPDGMLYLIVVLSLFTAVYAAGMALVQQQMRRFFCYLLLSHSSLVLVGVESGTAIGLTGALCVWISVVLALGGFGLTLRAVEARNGRLALSEYHGLYEHMPMLAGFFLLTGLASIGFPGTIGFIGAELLIEGSHNVSPLIGTGVVIAMTLNGLAMLHAWFHIFTGTRHQTSINLHWRSPERIAVLILTSLILWGGLWPQPGVESRYHAAVSLIDLRKSSRFLSTNSRPSRVDPREHDLSPGIPTGKADVVMFHSDSRTTETHP